MIVNVWCLIHVMCEVSRRAVGVNVRVQETKELQLVLYAYTYSSLSLPMDAPPSATPDQEAPALELHFASPRRGSPRPSRSPWPPAASERPPRRVQLVGHSRSPTHSPYCSEAPAICGRAAAAARLLMQSHSLPHPCPAPTARSGLVGVLFAPAFGSTAASPRAAGGGAAPARRARALPATATVIRPSRAATPRREHVKSAATRRRSARRARGGQRRAFQRGHNRGRPHGEASSPQPQHGP